MAKKAPKKSSKKKSKADAEGSEQQPRETSEHQELPGVNTPGAQRVAIDGIDRAYRNYRPVMEQRVSLLEKEKGLKNVVVAKMHEHIEELPRDEANNPYYITSNDKRLVLQTKGEKLVIVDEDSGNSGD